MYVDIFLEFRQTSCTPAAAKMKMNHRKIKIHERYVFFARHFLPKNLKMRSQRARAP